MAFDGKWKDKIPGGRADKKNPQDFDFEALGKGVKVEMEHTDDPQLAAEIAMDHLTEMGDYYDKLELMEGGEHEASRRARARSPLSRRRRVGRRAAEDEWKDTVPGGRADKKKPKDFDAAAIAKGVKVEMEHTDDAQMATEIAMDHLTEDPKYYDKLEKMEGGAHKASRRVRAFRLARRYLRVAAKGKKKIPHEKELTEFFKKQDEITDAEFHTLAEELKVSPHDLEAESYEMLRQRLGRSRRRRR